MIYNLTKDDTRAWRMAEEIILHHGKGEGTIRLRLNDRTNARIYTAAEQRLFPQFADFVHSGRERVITVPSFVSGFEYGEKEHDYRRWTGDEHTTAFAIVYRDDIIRSTGGLARAGYEVSLTWRGDHHSNGYSKEHGLHVDTVELTLCPPEGRAIVIPLTTSIAPDNSARMVHRYGS